MTYTPMPAHLDPQLQSVIREIMSSQPDAGNTLFVVREALAQAYAAGSKDAHGQAMGHQWLTEELKTTYAARTDKLKDSLAAAKSQPKEGTDA